MSVRAAIEGGLPVSTAYALQAYYTTRIEECPDVSSISAINLTQIEDFTYRVHCFSQKRNQTSLFLLEVEEYIDLNLENKLSISSLAEIFHYTEYYFSRKFKKESGISINDYLNRTKIKRTKFLLTNTTIQSAKFLRV